MPNWVYNSLTIEGNSDSVLKLKEQMNRPFIYSVKAEGDLAYSIKEVKYSKPVFAFYNIVAPTDLEAYHSTCNAEGMKNPNNWYNWNVRNWGVKWDVAVQDGGEVSEPQEVKNGSNLVLLYQFNTAWGIPSQALETLSAQYPDLLLTLSYEEETGWGGENEYLRGECVEGNSYNWKCYECDYEERSEPPYCEECEYEICPKCGFGEAHESCQTHGASVKSES